jgi:hypothetical protein
MGLSSLSHQRIDRQRAKADELARLIPLVRLLRTNRKTRRLAN